MLVLRRMKVSGFFSYREPVEVDWARLMEAGFFGLLGPTGAGKSALLDCLLIALFEKSARTDYSPNSVLNRHVREGWIELDFTLGQHNYRISYRRGRRFMHTLYREGSPEPIAVGEAVTQEVRRLLGLDYTHFTQAFLLEQGQFQRFLHSKPRERAEILTSLLKLEKLDLQRIVSEMEKEAAQKKTNLAQIEEKLEREADPQLEAQMDEELRRQAEEKEKITYELNSLRKEIEALNLQHAAWEELAKVRNDLGARQARCAELQLRKQRLEKIQRVRETMSGLFAQEKAYRQNLEKMEKEAKELDSQLSLLDSKAVPLLQQVERLKPLYEKQTEYQRLKEQIGHLRTYRDLEKQVQNLEKKRQDAEVALKKLQEKSEDLQEAEKELQNQLEQVETELNRLSSDLLTACSRWEDCNKRVQESEKTCGDYEQKLQAQRTRLRENFQLLGVACRDSEVAMPPQDATSEGWRGTFEALEKALNKALEAEKARLTHATWAAELAKQLRPGEPCPVCGSPQHPSPASPLPEDTARQPELKKAIETLRQLEKQYLGSLVSLESSLKEAHHHLKQGQEELARIEKTLQESFGLVPRAGLYAELEAQRKDLERQKAKVKAQLEYNRKHQNSLREEVEKARAEVDSSRHKLAELKGRREALASQLPEGGLSWSDKEIERREKEVQQRLSEINAYPELQKKAEQVHTRLAELRTRLEEQRKRLKEYRGQFDQVVQQLQQEAQKQGLDLAEARQLYAEPVDYESEGQAIEAFFQEIRNLQAREKELAPKVHSYHPRQLEDKKTRYDELQKQKEEIAHKQGQLQQRLEQVRQARAELDKMREEHHKIEKRHQYLKELNSLLEAKAFLQFVLRRYLARILALANRYLLQWNGGSWELVLSEGEKKRSAAESEQEGTDLELEVLDYLGEQPVRRSIKTLSGGQTFQASLALALVLSEQVTARMGREAQPGFLLIDEGFGSLDQASLEQVVSTLRQLARGSRAIGVITHREELKEELHAYLEVRLDEREGVRTSRVKPSWDAF